MTQTVKTSAPVVSAGNKQDALESLRQSEQRLRYFFDAAMEGIAIHDRGVILDANEAMARMFGYSLNEFIGRSVLDFTVPESREMLLERVRSGFEEPYEAVGLRKDGSTFVAEVRGKAASYEGRTVRVTVIRDVTDRRHATDAMSDWVSLMEVETHKVVSSNRAGEAIVGLPLREMLGRSCCQVVHGTPGPIPDCPLTKMLHTRRRESVETLLPNGRWVVVTVDPVTDSEGELVSAVHVVRDITERVQAEAALRESEEKFRLAFVTSPDSININRLEDGMYLDINEGFTAITGYTREETIGKTSREISIWNDPKDREKLVAGLRKDGYVSNLEAKFRMKDGSLVTGLMSAKVMMIGGVPHMLSVTRDIEALKQAEAALRQHARRLETLREIDRAILEAQSPEAIAQAALRHLRMLVPCARASVSVFDFVKKEAGVLAVSGPTKVGTDIRVPLDMAWVEKLRRGEVFMIEDFLTTPNLSEQGQALTTEGLRSYINVPLISQGELLGALNLGGAEPSAFDDEQIKIAREVAGPLAIAIQQARLHQETKRTVGETSALLATAQAITSLDLDHVLTTIAGQVKSLFKADGSRIHLVEPDGKTLRCVVAHHQRAERALALKLKLGQGITGRVALRGEAEIINHARADSDAIQMPGTPEEDETLALAPLKIRDEVIGVLTVSRLGLDRPFTTKDLALKAFASQAALSIHNARLYEEVQRHTAELEQRVKENARLHQRVLKQAQQLQQVLDTAPQGILLLDDKQHIELANPTATQVLPMLTDSAPGDVLSQLGNRPLEQILASQPAGLPYEVVGTAPPHRQFEVGASPLTANGPESAGWVLVLRDVTEERAARERLQQHERLAAVGQLAAGIAHDFNNLLQGIIGFADLLQHKPNLDDSTRHGLDVIATQGQHAARLVRQILDFSRRSVIEQQPMDLLALATETVHLLRRTVPGNVRITLDHDPAGSFVIYGDAGQLQNVLTNLAVNARDAMPEGGTLHLRLAGLELHTGDPVPFPDMKPGKWVTLAVSDSGTGIPADDLPHVFEPFFTTKEVGKGSGLGLAQVYGIVRQHEGYIDVTSEENQGTTFTVYLPAWHEPPADADLPDLESIPQGHGELILVVDDDPSVRQVCQAMVEYLGYETLSAGNGREAIAIYAEHLDEVGLVLSDIVMPAMGGVELARELRQIDPKAKVVLITGYPLGQAQRELKTEGVLDWIQKPLSLSELGEKVSAAMRNDEC